MKRNGTRLIVTACLLTLIFAANAVAAGSEKAVPKLDAAGLDKLIKDSRSSIVIAMAAWCFPCREELPMMVKLYNKYKGQGLEMVGLSIDVTGPTAIVPVMESAKVNFPVYWGGDPAVKHFQMEALPLNMLIKDGEVVARIVGRQDEEVMEEMIKNLLKK
jgi:thioredoxin-like negative regulator of GroEL